MMKLYKMIWRPMMVALLACPLSTSAATVQANEQREPVKMILDSDFGSSTDDLFLLMMLILMNVLNSF